MTSVFEEKNISKAIMRVGLPAMLGQLTTLIYNIADTYFVSLTKEPAMIVRGKQKKRGGQDFEFLHLCDCIVRNHRSLARNGFSDSISKDDRGRPSFSFHRFYQRKHDQAGFWEFHKHYF